MNKGGKDYARLLPILDQHPELLKDLDMNWLMSAANNDAREVKHQLFMGELEHQHKCTVQLVRIYLFKFMEKNNGGFIAIKNSPLLEPVVDRSYFSEAKQMVKNRREILKKADGWTVILEPGDVLYNPPFFWHQARSIDTNIGVGFRWFSLAAILKVSPAQLLMTITASNPSVREAKKVNQKIQKFTHNY